MRVQVLFTTAGGACGSSCAFLAFAGILCLVSSLVSLSSGRDYLPEGPSRRGAEVAESLWRTGALTPAYYETLRTSLREKSARNGSEIWQDAFALSRNGEIRPKHTILLPLIAYPFYGLFGELGFLILQNILTILLLYAVYRLCLDAAPRISWIWCLVTCALTTQILRYNYLFSYDQLGAVLIVGGFAALTSRPVAGAFLMMISGLVRPSNLLLAAPLCLAVLSQHCTKKHLEKVTIGASLAIMLILAVNTWLWGVPLDTAYDRTPLFRAGHEVYAWHTYGFEWVTFWSDWYDKLFDTRVGVVTHNVSLLALPCVILTKKLSFKECVVIASCLIYSLWVFSVQFWNTSPIGNRFLTAPVCLLFPIVFCAVRDSVSSWKAGRLTS